MTSKSGWRKMTRVKCDDPLCDGFGFEREPDSSHWARGLSWECYRAWDNGFIRYRMTISVGGKQSQTWELLSAAQIERHKLETDL